MFYSLKYSRRSSSVSLLNPMIYMVNGVRYGLLGVSEVDPNMSLAVLTGTAVVVL